MPQKIEFDDGSSVLWVNREGVEYRKGEFSVGVWVDYGPGFFSSNRIIIAASIFKWDTKPDGVPWEIDENTKEEIISKIRKK